MAEHDERRVHQRLPVPHVVVKISTPERMRVAYLKDLSKGGLFIKTDRPLALDRLVDVDLLPPGRATPIRVRCKVMRVRNDDQARQTNSQGMGLKFVDVDPEMMTALDALLEEYTSEPPAPEALAAPDAETVLFKQALEEVAALTAALADRDRELAEARQRREEVEARVLAEGSPSDELQRELETARAENAELQTRLSEALGDAEAYRHELAVMEGDDASMRRLAESLGQQKADLEAANAQGLEQGAQQLEAESARRTQAERKEAELAKQLEAERVRRTQAERKEAELAKQLEAERARKAQVERKEAEHAKAHAQLTARVGELEALLAEAGEQLKTAAELAPQLEAARARIAVLETAKPPPPAVSGPAVELFLRRLRANEPLQRLERFNGFTPADPRESDLMGLLEGCDRYSDLKALSGINPGQLEKMLVGFHQLTLIGFDREAADS